MTTHDHPAFVHANEAIVPLDRFPGMRSLMDGDRGRGGAGVNVNVEVTVEGGDEEHIVRVAMAAMRAQLLSAFRNDKRVRDAIGQGQQGSLHT